MARRGPAKVPDDQMTLAYQRGVADAKAGKNMNKERCLVPIREAYERGWKETASRILTRKFNEAIGW